MLPKESMNSMRSVGPSATLCLGTPAGLLCNVLNNLLNFNAPVTLQAIRQHIGAEDPDFNSKILPGPFCAELVCSPGICMSPLQVLPG